MVIFMKYIKQLKYHPLFCDMKEREIEKILSCFSFKYKNYSKDEYIILEGDPVQIIGIIIYGTVLMEKNDLHGNSYFFTEFRESDIFAEPFMDTNIISSSVNYKAMTNCHILFFNYRDIWRSCECHCSCHLLFIKNLTNLLALKSRILMAKIEILSKKSLRDRILTFFNLVSHPSYHIGISENHISAPLQPGQLFIPYNHTEMAEYLGVNRSALVRELKRMKDQNIIDYEKNIYTLL